MDSSNLAEAHYLIQNNQLGDLQNLFDEYKSKHPWIKHDGYQHTFRLLFVNACQCGFYDIVEWLHNSFFLEFKLSTQKSLRFIFPRCYQLALRNNKALHLHRFMKTVLDQNPM